MKRWLRAKIGQYTMESEVLFKKGYLVPMLRCVGPLQVNYVIREIHMGSCGMHVGPRVVIRKAGRHGYYWPTMHVDAKKEVEKGIKTRLGRERVGWVDELPNVLWAHQTSIKQSNGEIPFSLTYGSEAVIPAEIGIPTYRTLTIKKEYNEEEMCLNLDLLQERREIAAVREARYKMKMEQYYNKKVRPSSFRPGEFVFQRNEASRVEDQGKLRPKCEGPYRVIEAYEKWLLQVTKFGGQGGSSNLACYQSLQMLYEEAILRNSKNCMSHDFC
uniref:Reverse transcriptase domain-containing protein n=1 Tax=Tanacetum cinerariifolium TaxID=118510 RepID=A0A6L2JL57_TANCI|nr:reverse transcriptase domain-containing protein [Tanacetum cinerariifolium]